VGHGRQDRVVHVSAGRVLDRAPIAVRAPLDVGEVENDFADPMAASRAEGFAGWVLADSKIAEVDGPHLVTSPARGEGHVETLHGDHAACRNPPRPSRLAM